MSKINNTSVYATATPTANSILIGSVQGGGDTKNYKASAIWDNIQLNSSAPATAGAAGTAGNIAYDSNYLYVCVASNTWKRVAISTW